MPMAKRDALIEARDELGLRPADVLAVGDGANDQLMIEEAGLGIAFRAKPALAEVADAELEHHGLDALLWVQGFRRRDWCRAELLRRRPGSRPGLRAAAQAALAAAGLRRARPGAG